MGLLQTLERLLNKSQQEEQVVELKEIFCKTRGKKPVEQFRTAAVGCQYSNLDGSSRQDALKKLKSGERVRLIWNAGASGGRDRVYLLRGGRGQELSMPDCFGRLDDKVAARVIRWLTRDNIVTAAQVVKITGGTRRQPRLGCVLELTTYPGPRKKNSTATRK
jgi:hypothetical protein